MTLRTLIGFAYYMREFQISGGPTWINIERFDMNPKAESYDGVDSLPADPGQLTDEQRKTGLECACERLRSLLRERFQLIIRREIKEQQVYALVIAKGGPKLHQSTAQRDGIRTGRGMLSAQDRVEKPSEN